METDRKESCRPAGRKKESYYTLMVVPHDAQGRPLSLKIPTRWISAAALGIIFAVLLISFSVVYSALVSRRLTHYALTLAKNREQAKAIRSFSQETSKLGQAISELVAKENELRKSLGLKNWKSKIKLQTKFEGPKSQAADQVSLNLSLAKQEISEREKSLRELREWVSYVRKRFAATPSGWPVYGRLHSWFGYRSHPWRGFHSGIDISGRYGAPVRATAAGVVSYIGWRRGFGKTVEIKHAYGISTLYAHNSGYAVRLGQRVKKGQIVSYIGLTGWTTGSHLHYEVRKWDRPINPVAYLNLTPLTASRLWR